MMRFQYFVETGQRRGAGEVCQSLLIHVQDILGDF